MNELKPFFKFMEKTSREWNNREIAEDKEKKVFKHYSIKNILKFAAEFEKSKECRVYYHLVMSERSPGKTYNLLAYGIYMYFLRGDEFVYIRRHEEPYKRQGGQDMVANLNANGVVKEFSNGQWDELVYRAGKWFLSKTTVDEKGNEHTERSATPIGHALSLNTAANTKSKSFPKAGLIIFDEFIESAGKPYLVNEFDIFMNLISTIVRLSTRCKIFMLANTTRRVGCPYFTEMGLKRAKMQKPGEIDGYVYEDSNTGRKLGLVLEYLSPQAEAKSSNIYFAFNSPTINMITKGGWEIPSVPHIPISIRPGMEKFRCYLRYDDETLCMRIIQGEYKTYDEDGVPEKHFADFLAVTPHNNKIKDEDNQLVYSHDPDPRPSHRCNIKRPHFAVEKKLGKYIRSGNIFFSDNSTGATFYSYLGDCT